ncbi:hypothetical protein NM208_g122 [Fusarium decemcellulare]|uniref:Uncharacterized protein n=1 Tax=Fusarium decemcellulare TaxID=57161 RepID=A0ACC1T0M8_9HYPO|nr:hypothetical protein NM208_g122 [Fusarium decemcellulare]
MASSEDLQFSHLTVSLSSSILPISLRAPRSDEGAVYAALLANGFPDSAQTFDTAWGDAAVIRHREAAAVPTIVSTTSGAVISGPARVNLVIVEHGDEEKVVGLGGFGSIKTWQREGKIVRAGDAGVLLDNEAQGKGYGREAMVLAMDWAAAPASEGGLQLDMITITTLADNEPMIGLVQKKLGLEGKGLLRPAEFDKEKLEIYYEITAEDWRAWRGR